MAKGYEAGMVERRVKTMADLRLACNYFCVVRQDLRLDLISKISQYPGVISVSFMQAAEIHPE